MNRFFLVLPLLAGSAWAGIVGDVRVAIAQNNLALAESTLRDYRSVHGADAEALEAQSWICRGALAARQLDKAEACASETREQAAAQLKTRPPDADRHLATALGAAIEVQANVLASRGQRAEAVSLLRRDLKTYWTSSLRTRIQKNLHLLSLEGRPAPPIEVREWLGPKPDSLAGLKGRPVLLFFWAHWCPDCKAEAPVLAKLKAEFGPRGLVLIGPTQRYGYMRRGQEATPAQELAYIDEVRKGAYPGLEDMPVPVSEENFKNYGASTVPTLVLIDRRGLVRLYHPDTMSYEALAPRVEALFER